VIVSGQPLRNTTAFGIILCAVWILASFRIDALREDGLYVQDLLAFHLIKQAVETEMGAPSPGCPVPTQSRDFCGLYIRDPWISDHYGWLTFIQSDLLAESFKDLQPTTDAKGPSFTAWKSKNTNTTILSPLDKPTSLWEISADMMGNERFGNRVFEPYYILQDEKGRISVVSVEDLYVDTKPRRDIIIFSSEPEHSNKIKTFLSFMGQSFTEDLGDININDSHLGKLVHDYIDVSNSRETVAGLAMPLTYVPVAVGVLLIMVSILLGGIAAALNMGRRRVYDLTEEYGWPLLYSGGGGIGLLTLLAGLTLAIVALSAPGVALYRTWIVAVKSPNRELALWFLIGSLSLFSLSICLNVTVQLMLRQSIRTKETPQFVEKEENEEC
jgi:hypothetical protein